MAALVALAPGAGAQEPAPAQTIKLKTSHDVLRGQRIKVRGLLAGPAGHRVFMQRSVGSGWKTFA